MRVYTEADFPTAWATTQNNLGNAYADLPAEDGDQSSRRAIACYEAALRVWTEADFPTKWATTQNNLGAAYAVLPTGDRDQNLRRAIACYEAALRVYTEADFPTKWAMIQNNLSTAQDCLRKRNEILREVVQMVRDQIGPVADFKHAVIVERLPKTRSGKILRGTMQKIADHQAHTTPATIDDPAILSEVTEALGKISLKNLLG